MRPLVNAIGFLFNFASKAKRTNFVFIAGENNMLCAEKFSHIIEKPTNKWITKDITLDADNLC